jgi:hypothetical protein
LFLANRKEVSNIVFRLIRRARGFVIAIAVLALTAGAALAGRSPLSTPAAAADGLAQATAASGQTVPVAGQEESAPGADEDTDTDVDENEPAEDTTDSAGVHPDNHGKLVSEAAKGATPEAFDNHGAYVKSVATVNAGLDPNAQRGASKAKKPSR